MPNTPVPATAEGMRQAIQHFYREFRRHQRSIYADGGGALCVYPSGRTELSYGSAPYGEHALSAFTAAKRHIAFRAELKRTVQKIKRRRRTRRHGAA